MIKSKAHFQWGGIRVIRSLFVPAFAVAALISPLPTEAQAQALKTSIEDYGKLPAVEDVAISPSGNRYAILSADKGVRAIRVIENGKIIKAFGVDDAKIRYLYWATENLVMVTLTRTEKLSREFTTDKAEFARTLFIDLAGGPTRLLFEKQKDIAPATFGFYGIREIAGKRYGFFGGVPLAAEKYSSNMTDYVFKGGAPGLYRVDFSDLSVKKMAAPRSDDETQDWIVNGQGEIAATLFMKSSGDWRIVNAESSVIARGKQLYGSIDVDALGRGSQSVIYSEAGGENGDYQYFEIPLAGGERKPLFDGGSPESFYRNHMTAEIIGYKLRDAEPYFYDEAIGQRRKKIGKAFPKLNHQIKDYDDSFSRIVVSTSGTGDSGTWWQVDAVALKASPLGYERPNIYPDDVGPISTVSYKAADGLEMDGILTLPAGREAKNLPAIMLPHGGPHSHDEAAFDWWAQAFAAKGYAVFQPNFRGSTNRGANFVSAGYGEWGKKMQTDISDGLKHLATQGIVDSKRVCIVGASYGGYAALAGVTIQQGIYRCAVSVAGVSDLPMLVNSENEASGGNDMLRRGLKRQIGSGKDIKEVSPRKFAAQADAPVLLIHGKDDTVVLLKQSEVMADALKDAGKPYELIVLKGEDHYLSLGDTRMQMLQATLGFVEKHNPPN
jgi:dienelactone hydrolase